MKRVSISFPLKYSNELIRSLGAFNAFHPTREFTIKGGYRDAEQEEIIQNYTRLKQRLDSILSAVDAFGTPRRISKLEAIKHYFRQESPPRPLTSLTRGNIKDTMRVIEAELENLLVDLDRTKNRIAELEKEHEKIIILKEHGIKLNQIGDFRYIFVKVGLMRHEKLPIFRSYCQGTQIAYSTTPVGRDEVFLIVTGPIDYKDYVIDTLALLNFHEFEVSEYESHNPTEVLENIEQELKENRQLIEEMRIKSIEMQKELLAFKIRIEHIRKTENVRATICRIGDMGLIHGWVPSNKVDELKHHLESAVPGVVFDVEDPTPIYNVPSDFSNKGILGNYGLFTRLRGIPNYFELDPTPIVALFYPIMFGIMFGDMGAGSIFLVLGLILSRVRKSLMGLSSTSIRRLGGIFITCGISSIFFGVMYGELFLLEVIHPVLNPLHDQEKIMGVSLIFGVVQISIGIVISIVNKFRSRNIIEGIIGEQGLLRLLFYISGILLAYNFIISGMDLNAIMENTILLGISVTSLGIIFFSHLIEGIIHHEGNYTEKLIMGFGAVLETFISLLANSISYIRIAAFAMTHSALAVSAETLAQTIGVIPSYLFLNILVFTIEGLSTIIQSTRLIFYEFFTKFYQGTGRRYKPFILTDLSQNTHLGR